MREKIIFGVSLLVVGIISSVGTVLITNFIPIRTEIVEKEVKNVTVTESDTIQSAVGKVYDGVVVVENYKGNKKYSSGTGFVYKKDDQYGYIITNNHVIEGATSIKVTNTEGETVEAKLLGSDEYADLAVLSIEKDAALNVLEIGDSTKLSLGDTLFTVGTPVDSAYMGTVTKGILSGKNRTVSVSLSNGDFMMEVLQTDAAINPGNSGGPLVNINGQVVGVNSMKLVEEKIEGMGFAIPIEIAMSCVDRLEKGEKIVRPLFGASMIDANNTYQLYSYNIYLEGEFEKGTVIANVQNGSSAANAGIQKGDVIVSVDGTDIVDTGHFRFLLYKYKVGDTATLKINRKGEIKEIKVTLSQALDS